jgi:hypothetical protein
VAPLAMAAVVRAKLSRKARADSGRRSTPFEKSDCARIPTSFPVSKTACCAADTGDMSSRRWVYRLSALGHSAPRM